MLHLLHLWENLTAKIFQTQLSKISLLHCGFKCCESPPCFSFLKNTAKLTLSPVTTMNGIIPLGAHNTHSIKNMAWRVHDHWQKQEILMISCNYTFFGSLAPTSLHNVWRVLSGPVIGFHHYTSQICSFYFIYLLLSFKSSSHCI